MVMLTSYEPDSKSIKE